MNNFELVVAMDMDGCIGKSNSIPWHLPEDLKYFKELTENSIVIMGRLTFESLPYGPLKNRINIVISKKLDNAYNDSNVIVTDMIDVFNIVEKYRVKYSKVFVIGGSQIYNLFIKYCNKLHITNVYVQDITVSEKSPNVTYFNKSLLNNFNIINKSGILTSKKNLLYMFCTYERVSI